MRRREAGVTLSDVVVSTGLVGIAAVLAFGMQARVGRLFREQQALAEAQQTLRTSGELIARELRQAGYLAARVRAGAMGQEVELAPLSARSVGDASDVLRVIYADVAQLSRVRRGSPFEPAATVVDDASGWAAGDAALVVRTGGPLRGHACVLAVTGTDGGGVLLHDPLRGAPWNLPENRQCAELVATWGDGDTAFARLAARAYRVAGDALQFSPSGGFIAGDWVDLAVGVVDLQVALRVYQPGDALDADGDGDAEREWYSGDGMEGMLAMVPGSELLSANVTLVVRAGPGPQAGYRTVTTTVNLRNLGIGR